MPKWSIRKRKFKKDSTVAMLMEHLGTNDLNKVRQYVQKLYDENGAEETAEILGISRITVYQVFAQLGVKTDGNRKIKKVLKGRGSLESLLKKHKTIYRLARHLGISPITLYYYARRQGFKYNKEKKTWEKQ